MFYLLLQDLTHIDISEGGRLLFFKPACSPGTAGDVAPKSAARLFRSFSLIEVKQLKQQDNDCLNKRGTPASPLRKKAKRGQVMLN
ncbi:hypothetical protein MLD38_032895 [Melastoma candidum]|uniref:Uncharacterized protein n=1 Tax=Melastoma candidum TaxID=119954 RepID=A0ACB9M4R2_9MYRT|nr:hypothetical protein MLD38_032895 [Melastoma candidum]